MGCVSLGGLGETSELVICQEKRLFAISFRPCASSGAGFSLIELLVVIGIMAVVATMAMSIGPGFLRSLSMKSSLSAVASAVSLARSDAIRSRKQTYFVLAPTIPLDERSYTAYAVIRQEDSTGTNYRYVTPWKKLPVGVLFNPTQANTVLATASLPYPRDSDSKVPLRVISFVSDGSLDEELHPEGGKPVLPMQVGTRSSATDQPSYQGAYITNQITVERLSGKVKVLRQGETIK